MKTLVYVYYIIVFICLSMFFLPLWLCPDFLISMKLRSADDVPFVQWISVGVFGFLNSIILSSITLKKINTKYFLIKNVFLYSIVIIASFSIGFSIRTHEASNYDFAQGVLLDLIIVLIPSMTIGVLSHLFFGLLVNFFIRKK